MTLEEFKHRALAKVEEDNPGNTGFRVSKVYEHIMDGTLITVTFQTSQGKEDSNHVHFGRDEVRVYRWHSDALSAVANYKERVWFFRFLETAGIGGVIAFILVIVFSVLLCVLAFSPTVNASIVDIVKLAFTIILGFFFGQAATSKK
jgi:hypothetical protein